jgi:hypothetical protein
MGGPALEPKDMMQRSPSGRTSGPSKGPKVRAGALPPTARATSEGILPFGGSTMIEVRFSPLMSISLVPGSTQKLL